MDPSNSPVQSKQNRGHQTGTTQRQVFKKEIKLEAVDDQQRPFDDTILLNHRLICNYPDHHSGKEMLKLQQKVDQLVCEATAREEEMEKLTNEVISQSQGQLQEFQQRIQNLEKNGAEKDLKIADLTALLSSQTRKIKKHDTDAETIKVTLDEKQKQVAELERSLNDEKKKVVELEKILLAARRAFQGFVTDRQRLDKEVERLKIEARKKDVALAEPSSAPLIAPVKKLAKRKTNENEIQSNPTTNAIHSAGSPHVSFVKVTKKNVHFGDAKVANLYCQTVGIEARNSSKKIIELDIFIEDSKDFGMLDERGSSVSRLFLKVESGKKIYLQVSFSPRCPGNFNTQLVITPCGEPASNLRYPVSLSGEVFW